MSNAGRPPLETRTRHTLAVICACLGVLAGCGSGGGDSTSGGTEPDRQARRVAPPQLAPPAPVAAAPGALSGGSMWARGMTGGGGGGGGLARETFERNRAERLAREGPQRPLSERHDELVREGQERARELAAQLPASSRAALESPPNPDQSASQAVRERCTALMQANQSQLAQRGDARGTTGPAFLARCQQFPIEFFRCTDQGEAARDTPECRQQFARLDREVRTLRTQGREVTNPAERIDLLADEQWETEREEVQPETLAPEAVDQPTQRQENLERDIENERPPPVVLQ